MSPRPGHRSRPDLERDAAPRPIQTKPPENGTSALSPVLSVLSAPITRPTERLDVAGQAGGVFTRPAVGQAPSVSGRRLGDHPFRHLGPRD